MSTVLHISDTHFGTEQPAVVEALLRLANAQMPDLVVLSGDVTQRATRSQFIAARRFVDRLPAPKLVLAGNHDIPLYNVVARTLTPYKNYQRQFGAALDPQFESADLLVVGIKTTRRYRHKNGEVSPDQIRHVAQRLLLAKSRQLRIVVTHQPVHVTRARDEKNLLHGARDAVRSWAKAGADLILSGHIHLPFAARLSDRYGDLARGLWIAQAGTAVSSRVRHEAPNSVNLIRHESGSANEHYRIERWDYAAASTRTAHGEFVCVNVTSVDRQPCKVGDRNRDRG